MTVGLPEVAVSRLCLIYMHASTAAAFGSVADESCTHSMFNVQCSMTDPLSARRTRVVRHMLMMVGNAYDCHLCNIHVSAIETDCVGIYIGGDSASLWNAECCFVHQHKSTLMNNTPVSSSDQQQQSQSNVPHSSHTVQL
jgi:hypothetical protein